MPSWAISVSVSESRSAMISGQEPERRSAAMASYDGNGALLSSPTASSLAACSTASRDGLPQHGLAAGGTLGAPAAAACWAGLDWAVPRGIG